MTHFWHAHLRYHRKDRTSENQAPLKYFQLSTQQLSHPVDIYGNLGHLLYVLCLFLLTFFNSKAEGYDS